MEFGGLAVGVFEGLQAAHLCRGAAIQDLHLQGLLPAALRGVVWNRRSQISKDPRLRRAAVSSDQFDLR